MVNDVTGAYSRLCLICLWFRKALIVVASVGGWRKWTWLTDCGNFLIEFAGMLVRKPIALTVNGNSLIESAWMLVKKSTDVIDSGNSLIESAGMLVQKPTEVMDAGNVVSVLMVTSLLNLIPLT